MRVFLCTHLNLFYAILKWCELCMVTIFNMAIPDYLYQILCFIETSSLFHHVLKTLDIIQHLVLDLISWIYALLIVSATHVSEFFLFFSIFDKADGFMVRYFVEHDAVKISREVFLMIRLGMFRLGKFTVVSFGSHHVKVHNIHRFSKINHFI